MENIDTQNQVLAAIKELARLSSLALPRYLTYAPWTRISFENGFAFDVNGDVTSLDPVIFRLAMEKLHPLLINTLDTSTLLQTSPELPSDSVGILLLKILFSKQAVLEYKPQDTSPPSSKWWSNISELSSPIHRSSPRHERPKNLIILDAISRRGVVEQTIPSELSSCLNYFNAPDELNETLTWLSGFENTSLLVLLLPYNLDNSALQLNRRLVENGTPFLRCGVGSTSFDCGPLVIPGSSPCLECVWRRRIGTQPIIERFAESEQFANPANNPLDLALFGFLWLEVLRIMTEAQYPHTLGHIITGDLLGSSVLRRRILRLPRCSACG